MSHSSASGLVLNALLVAELFGAMPAASPFDVPIRQTEAFENRTLAWPVTTAVPMPEGKLREPLAAQLLDERGRPVAAHIEPSGWWRHSGTVQWVRLRYVAEPGRHYALRFNGDPAPVVPREPVRVREADDEIVVSTGPLEVTFSRGGPAEVLRVRSGGIDLFQARQDAEHYFIDQHGRRRTPTPQSRAIRVESHSPVHAVIHCQADYIGDDGQPLVKQTTRYRFFSGLPYFQIGHAFRILVHTQDLQFRDIAYRLPLSDAATAQAAVFDASAALDGTSTRCEITPATRAVSMAQEVARHYAQEQDRAALYRIDKDGDEQVVQHGDRAGGYVDVAGKGAQATVALRWLWQQFPKELEVTPRDVVVHLWSPRGGDLDFSVDGCRRFWGEDLYDYWTSPACPARESDKKNLVSFSRDPQGYDTAKGLEKGHELWIWPRGSQVPAEQVAQFGRLVEQPVLALADPAWACASGVFGPMAPKDAEALPEIEKLIEGLVSRRLEAAEAWGDYGWWAFGANDHAVYTFHENKLIAVPYRFTHGTYHRLRSIWALYFRSGDRRVLDLLLPELYHLMDIRYKHVADKRWRPGAYGGYTTMPIYWWSHDTAFADTIDFGMREFFWAYQATGDERFKDLLDMWLESCRQYVSSKPDGKQQEWPGWYVNESYAGYTASWARGVLAFLNSLTDMYAYSGDPMLLDRSRTLAEFVMDPESPAGIRRMIDRHILSEPYYWINPLMNYAAQSGDKRPVESCRRLLDTLYFAVVRGGKSDVATSELAWGYHLTGESRFVGEAMANLRPHMELPATASEEGARSLSRSSEEKQMWDGLPRLALALRDLEAKKEPIPPPRALPAIGSTVAMLKAQGQPLIADMTTDERPSVILDPAGQPVNPRWWTAQAYEAFNWAQHVVVRLRVPAEAPPGTYLVQGPREIQVLNTTAPRLAAWVPEAARLGGQDGDQPMLIPADKTPLTLRVRFPAKVSFTDGDGKAVQPARVEGQQVTFDAAPAGGVLGVSSQALHNYLLLHSREPGERWMGYGGPSRFFLPQALPSGYVPPQIPDTAQQFVKGVDPQRSDDQALQLTAGAKLVLPTRTGTGNEKVLFPDRQGTIEFWYQPLWDSRWQPTASYDVNIINAAKFRFICYGHPTAGPSLDVKVDGPLNMGWAHKGWRPQVGRWYHFAITWFPWDKANDKTLVLLFIDGKPHDSNVRSGDYVLSTGGWAPRPNARIAAQMKFAGDVSDAIIDELRISAVPRYVNFKQLTSYEYEPQPFSPTRGRLESDEHTLLLMHFDGSLDARWGAGETVKGTIEEHVP